MRVRYLVIFSALLAAVGQPSIAGEITRGPILQDVRLDGVVIAWEGFDFSGPLVAFGVASLEESSAPASCLGVHCFATLFGLPADSDYMYEVRDGSGPLAAPGTFRTAPDWPRPFSFAVFGDNRSDHASHSMVVDMMLADEFEIVMNTGDMVSDGEVEDDWDVFFGIEADLFRSNPFYPTVGNHEESDGAVPIVERVFHTPAVSSGSGEETYYSFDYGSVHFLVIDDFVHVNPWYLCILQGKMYDLCFTADQESWILADLQAAAADPAIDHVFVFVHEGPYSSKENRTGSAAMRELLPVFATSKVRIVFSGHDHLYEHGISGNGLHYVVTGGGGAPLYGSKPDFMNQMFPHEILMVESIHNFQIVEVAGEWVKMSTWDVDNAQIIDEIELGTPPACVVAEDCVDGMPGTCEGTWGCIDLECVWVCAPPPACQGPEDCPEPDEGGCPGQWECTPEETCLWVCASEAECLEEGDCAEKPPLSGCPGGAFQCTDSVCEWLCPPPPEGDVVATADAASSDTLEPEDILSPKIDSQTPTSESEKSGGCAAGASGSPGFLGFLLVLALAGLPGRRRRGAGLLVCFGVLVVAGAVSAGVPRDVHLSYSHPDTATTLTVTWATDSVQDPSVVRYGVDGDLDDQISGESFQGNGELGAIHSVELTGLSADTLYTYQVGGTGEWSSTFSFQTAPDVPCRPYRFVVLGDNRPDMAWLPQIHWNPILSESIVDAPLFLLHSGDIVMDGAETGQWRTFFESSGHYLANTPFMATIGNHDDGPGDGDTANYNQLFAYPRNSVTQTEDYYFFTTPDAIFVSLSTQTFNGGSAPFQEQADWLDQVLTDNPRPWKIVVLHHPPYTSHAAFDLGFWAFEFNHPPNEQDQNPTLVPIFDKHHVDIVFAGHNHYYERFAPMKKGPGNEQGSPSVGFHDGTVYVITGGAGAFVYDEFDIFGVELDLINWICGEASGSTVCSGKHHFVSVTINGPSLTYEAIATAEQTLDNDPSNVELLDSFIIIKAGLDICPEEPPPEPSPEPSTDVEEAPDVTSEEVIEAPDIPPGEDSGPAPDMAGEIPAPSVDTSGQTETAAVEDIFDTTPGPKDDGGQKSGGCTAGPTGASPALLLLLIALLAFPRRSRRVDSQ
ncbi:MAG: metallophosphoesterase [Pseudomonadota bacterium]